MKRTLVLTFTVAVGAVIMTASSHGLLGGHLLLAQQAVVPVVTMPGSGEVLTLDSGTMRILTDGSQTNGSVTVIDGIVRPGYRTNVHRHAFAESFHILEGTMTVEIDGETLQVSAGGYVRIPENVPHGFSNDGRLPVRSILTATPSGIEALFRKRATATGQARAPQSETSVPDTAFITTPDSAESLPTDSGTARILASESQTKGAFGVMDSTQAPNSWTVTHEHAFAEAFYVVDGTLTVRIDDGPERQLPPGSYVFIPAGVRHAQGNRGDRPVRTVITTHPTGLERMFRQRAEEFRKSKQGIK